MSAVGGGLSGEVSMDVGDGLLIRPLEACMGRADSFVTDMGEIGDVIGT